LTICQLPATELARRIHAKDLSAREVVSACLDRIARVNPSVNAIVTLVADEAMERARLADEALARGEPVGLLHGLPIAHKDLQITRGVRTTFGSPIYKDFVPADDSLLVERIKRAGAILVGKTNTPEFGAGSQTFNPVFGATRNPYDTTKTSGGSSGGAAVALACGMLPLADGTDMGGSLRNPASFCGIVGLRPSPGRVPTWPARLGWSPLSVDGPMARTVSDVALFLSAIAGPDSRSPLAIAEPGTRFGRPLGRDFKGVRVAWWKDLGGLSFDPAVTQVVNAQRARFESLGCLVEDAEPDFAGADEAFKTLRAVSFVANYRELVAKHGPLVKDTILWELERAERMTAKDIGEAEVMHTNLYHRVRQFFQQHEFFVLPTVQVSPFDLNLPYPTVIAGEPMTTYIDWMKSCYYISVAGTPAISVPCGFTPDGLPVGLQIVARHQDEWGLLQIAHAFEQAVGLHDSSSLAQRRDLLVAESGIA
jgi:amidase